ncbi:MAG: DUF411 domain-containing protein [Gammaproteobacteria bacterium]|nr:DUF411 domain-containing protein [Gammaproteobacteria bacterium]MCF6231285.1 DUF411 domain-containing protein [Gammaproteobacteria bacterium]
MKWSVQILLSLFIALSLHSAAYAESIWDPKQPPALIEKPLNITVYRAASCGCCKDWIDHLEKHNFKVEDVVSDDMNTIKHKLGLPGELASCHTGIIDGYVIEGHVPAQDIKQLINRNLDIAGLAVPQMPHGSPGMETGRKDDFSVIAFDKEGNFELFNQY